MAAQSPSKKFGDGILLCAAKPKPQYRVRYFKTSLHQTTMTE